MWRTLFLSTLPLLIAGDLLWLGVVAKQFYAKHLGYLMSSSVSWSAAVIFYLLYSAAITFFVTLPTLEKHSLATTALYGALFGLVCYGTYDLTNHATLKNWPLVVTIVDMAWGILLTAGIATLAVIITRKLG